MENLAIDIDVKSHVEAQINEIIDNRAWWTGTFDKIDKTVRHLEKLVCSVEGIDSYEYSKKLWNELSADSLKMMNDGYCRWETEIENLFAHKILTESNTKVEDYLLYDRFVRLLTKELELLKDFQFDSILFIGSGPFPITAILLHTLTGKRVDCLELQDESAEISRRVLKKLGLADAIKVHGGNGKDFELDSYDVVLAALLAKPKLGIMQNVLKSASPEVKVLCRTSEGMRRLLYESTSQDAYDGFEIHGMQNAGLDDTISTVLVSKAQNVQEPLEFLWIDNLTDLDLDALNQMHNQIFANDNNNGFTNTRQVDDYYFSQLKSDVQAGLKRLLIIKDSRKYYGQVVINLYHQDTYVHRCDISSLMLDKSARSKQVSLQIAEHLISECERLKLELVTIDVRAGSGQEKLWRYLGFESYGVLPQYAKVSDKYYSGIFMVQGVDQMKVLLKRRLSAMYSN